MLLKIRGSLWKYSIAEHFRVLGAGLVFRCRVSLLFTKSLYGIDTLIYVIDTFSHSHRSFFQACFFVRVKKQSDSRLSPIREYISRIASVVKSYKMYISSKYKIHGQRRTILAKWFLHDLAWNIICVLQNALKDLEGIWVPNLKLSVKHSFHLQTTLQCVP